MKRGAFLVIPIIAVMAATLLTPTSALAVEASNVQALIKGSRVTVSFDIPGDSAVDVDVSFSDESGPVNHTPGTLSGDIGKGIKPGKGRLIAWDFLKDHVYGLISQKLVANVTLSGGTMKDAPEPKKGGNMPKVKIETSMGVIVAELDAEKAPISVENFLAYVNEGFFDGTIFHRVIDGFMAQGGGFNADMKTKKEGRPAIKNEAANGLKNDRGTLAMARTSVVDSATSQFFINLVDNGFLNHRDTSGAGFGYAVFGKVVEGMDVVDAIGKVKTGNQDVPEEAVIMEKVTVIE
jgi:cyclophilin family peptidyl-prolyl cis-trans isomerase